MPQYRFQAVTQEGVFTEGSLFASSKVDAVESLSRKGWTATHLTSTPAWHSFRKRITHQQLHAWYSMFADLLSSGMPVIQCLELLSDRSSNRFLSEATRDVRSRVFQGETLSQSMSNHPQIFDPLAQSLVAAGERGSFLDQVLGKIADIKESQAKMRGRLISASAYPLFLVLVGIAVLTGMLFFFVPKFEPLFQRMRDSGGLPWSTEALFAINRFLQHHGFMVMAGTLGFLWFGTHWMLQPNHRTSLDRFLLRNRWVGSLVSGLAIARFCQILSNLLASGVRIQEALLIAGQSSGNRALELSTRTAIEKLSSGVGLADSLEEQGILPRETVELIRLGERSNRLEKVLVSISTRMQARNEQLLDALLRLLEPMLMVIMAVLIGFIMTALLMPIFSASGQSFQ